MGEFAALRQRIGDADGSLKIYIGEHIAVNHQKRRVAQQGQGGGDAACGFQTFAAFGRIGDVHAVCRAVAQRGFNLRAQPCMVNHDLADACGLEAAQVPANQRLAACGQEGFGGVVGERAHPFAAPCGKYHGFHSVSNGLVVFRLPYHRATQYKGSLKTDKQV